MASRPKPAYAALDLGSLPATAINRVLGTELEEGNVRLSVRAHEHVATDHAADYVMCLAALAGAIATPTFVGQAPRHASNFELVKRGALPDGRALLVAIGLEPGRLGAYGVRTCYPLTTRDVEAKRAAGTLKPILLT